MMFVVVIVVSIGSIRTMAFVVVTIVTIVGWSMVAIVRRSVALIMVVVVWVVDSRDECKADSQ